jgi:uncharacterized protein (TIGR02271 family)
MTKVSLSGTEDARTVPIVEEVLDVGTVLVDRGGYRLTKHVASREEIVDVPLHTHQVEIERRAIGRELGPTERLEPWYEGDTLVVPVVEEVVVTLKKQVLIEEIRIARHRSQTRDPRAFTLRKEEIQIERLDAESSDIETPSPPPDRV